ncbi:lysophospholipid acyltransferase family protein [Methylosinus sp. Sm6]|uniref:lysophospholipid acyltransferase family protein n=1 Tax=Methylosinus sp. Sm6 TaxID=2866948 RepID=UPI001C9A242C|nr:lysophospholipid acyltransferase family protein [Methylosinus sp. Sm6]MBY6240304.1 1-acyl-sn-glycerol-3-phosphate acyltransferase [Methylosinus sp. Sm6]
MIDLLLIGLTRFLVGGQAEWREGAPTARQRIYFANHSSHLDTLLIWAALPRSLRACTHPVAAADYWGKDALRRHIAQKVLRAVLIDRSRQQTQDPLDPLRATLARGRSLIFFPEGTRSDGGPPRPFKSGLFRLAEEFPAVELVPVYLRNPARAFPKGALLPVPIACTLHFGAPLRLDSGEERGAFLDRARDAVVELAQ